MTEREKYLIKASDWTHHHPYVETPRKKIESPIPGYEQYPGWQIVIMITSECNANCKMCYLPFHGKIEPNHLNEMIMNFQDQGYNVYLNGSEPLIDPRYLTSLKLADQKIVMTNGIVLYENPDYIYEIKAAGIETIGVSHHFDATEIFGSVKPYVAETALEIIEDAGVHARVMTSITRPFIEKIPEYCAWCKEKGYKEIRFTNYIAQGKAKYLDRDLILRPEDRKRYYEIITQERKKYPIDELCVTSCGSFGACGTPNMTCMAMRDFVVITPNMHVYPCIFQAEPGMECGFVHEGRVFTKKGFTLFEHDCANLLLYNKT